MQLLRYSIITNLYNKEDENTHRNTNNFSFLDVLIFCYAIHCLFLLFTISNTKSPLQRSLASLKLPNKFKVIQESLSKSSRYLALHQRRYFEESLFFVCTLSRISIRKVLDEHIKSCEWKTGNTKEVK